MQRQRLLLVVLLIALFLLLLFVVACGTRQVSSRASASEDYSADVWNGAWLYVEYACVQCHGLGGKGRSALQVSGPSLVSAEFRRTYPKDPRYDQALVNLIRNGLITEGDRAASMPAWNGILSDEEIRSIVAYIRSGLPDVGVPLLRARTGEEIYRAFACIKCHGPLGTGGIRNAGASETEHQSIPPLGGSEFKQKYESVDKIREVVLNGRIVEGGKPGVLYTPAWGKIGTADQIEKVIEYIYGY